MTLDAHDVQICLWKLLRLSTETFAAVSAEYPLFSSSLLAVFLLYLFFPSVFWALAYTFPCVVCIGVLVASWLFSRNEARRFEEEGDRRTMSSYGRVHSVRRRRPRDIRMQKMLPELEKAVVDVVDKNALIEENPKEIREVLVLPGVWKRDNFSRSFAVWEEGTGGKEKNKNGDVADLGISNAERTKRLESLIARRRLRKLLNHESAMKLLGMERNYQLNSHVSSLLIPRTSTLIEDDLFNSPGSAPSVLIPARNPFDIPYDPQEEKPDLTGDTFQQEFSNGKARDFTYCRHESFRLRGNAGTFCNEEQSKSRDRKPSSDFQLFMKHDEEFPVTMDQELYHFSESKTTEDNPIEDQIKEVIQVHQSDSRNAKVETDDGDASLVPKEGFCSGSSSRTSISSTDSEPVYNIDKETILKSLYSISRRSHSQEQGSKEKVGESFLTAGAGASQLFRHSMHHHLPSYSIASDLEVEVSEVSSPTMTINDSISCTNDEDMEEKKITWDGVDIWTGSSHPSQVEDCDPRSSVDEVSEADVIRVGFSWISVEHLLLNNMEENLCSESESPVSSKRSTNLDEKIFRTFEKSLSSMPLPRKDAMSGIIHDTISSKMLQVASTVSDNNDHCYLTQTQSVGALSSIEATENGGDGTNAWNAAVVGSSTTPLPASVLHSSDTLPNGSLSSVDWDGNSHQTSMASACHSEEDIQLMDEQDEPGNTISVSAENPAVMDEGCFGDDVSKNVEHDDNLDNAEDQVQNLKKASPSTEFGMQVENGGVDSEGLPVTFSSQLEPQKAEDKYIHADDEQTTVNSMTSSPFDCGLKYKNSNDSAAELVISVESDMKNLEDLSELS